MLLISILKISSMSVQGTDFVPKSTLWQRYYRGADSTSAWRLTRAVFHRFHTKVGQFLLHITTQAATVQPLSTIVSVIFQKEHGLWDNS